LRDTFFQAVESVVTAVVWWDAASYGVWCTCFWVTGCWSDSSRCCLYQGPICGYGWPGSADRTVHRPRVITSAWMKIMQLWNLTNTPQYPSIPTPGAIHNVPSVYRTTMLWISC